VTVVARVRLRFTKLGKVRWTSHRDVARMWERALRRAEVPVAYTEGYSPRPRLAFGLALSTGHESLGEYLDVDVADAVDVPSLPARLTPALPTGIDCVVGVALDGTEPSLQQAVTACTWEIELAGVDVGRAIDAVAAALAAPSLIATRTRKGHEVIDDLRPAIVALAVTADGSDGDGIVVTAEVATQPRGLRPGELVEACFGAVEARRVLRTHQWIEQDGARREPIPVDATSLPHALGACA
jgi:radical SAM-linked protein